MCEFLKNSISIFIVILKLCFETSDAYDISDLETICSVADKLLTLTSLPEDCIAIADYTNDLEHFPEVVKLKNTEPFIVIVDTVDFNFPQELDDLFKAIDKYPYDFIAFDLHALIHKDGTPPDSTQSIIDFIKNVKPKNGVIKGLLIQNDCNWLRGKIDFGPLNEHVGFYILQSTGYKDCDYQKNQGDMHELASVDDITGSVNTLTELHIDLGKLIYTIDLKIESRTRLTSEAMTYSYLCHWVLSDDRKYCVNSLEQLFHKARLKISLKMAGVFIKGAQYDDSDGSCECVTDHDTDATYRGIRTIALASYDGINPFDFYKCHTGAYPTIRS